MSCEKFPSLAAIILAAGKGVRMNSDLPKVMHTVGGQPMLVHVINQAKGAGIERIIVIVGYKREMVIPIVEQNGAEYVIQEEQLGTGHAVSVAEPLFRDYHGDIIVLSGDVPLLSIETLHRIVDFHRGRDVVATMLTAYALDPTDYGRVLRGNDGEVKGVKEHDDCDEEELRIKEINSGIYVFRSQPLFDTLRLINNKNAQREYYLPDVFLHYLAQKEKVAAYVGDFDEIHGVNNLQDLEKVREIYERRSVTA